MTAITAEERETTVTASDADDTVRIWTAQRSVITRLRNHPAFTETGTGRHGTSQWAQFEIPADRWSPAGVRRTLTLTDEQRAARGERLRQGRAAS